MNKIDLSKIKTAEQLNDLCKGTFVDYLGIEMISVDDVGAVARMKISNINMAPNGYVHGGVIASLAETTCGNGTIFHLGKEEAFSTIEFKINSIASFAKLSLPSLFPRLYASSINNTPPIQLSNNFCVLIAVCPKYPATKLSLLATINFLFFKNPIFL